MADHRAENSRSGVETNEQDNQRQGKLDHLYQIRKIQALMSKKDVAEQPNRYPDSDDRDQPTHENYKCRKQLRWYVDSFPENWTQVPADRENAGGLDTLNKKRCFQEGT